jgi:hypothetical protein
VTLFTAVCRGIRRSSHGVSTSSTNVWVRSRYQVTTRPDLRFAPPTLVEPVETRRPCRRMPACGIRRSHGVSTSSTNAWVRSRLQVTTRPCLRFVRPRWSSLSRPGDHVYGCLPRHPQVVSRGLDKLDQRVGAVSRQGHDATGAAVRAPTLGRLTGSRQARPTRGCVLETRSRRDPVCGSRAHAGRACRDPVTMSTDACRGIRRSSHGVSTGSTDVWVRSRLQVTTRPALRFVRPRRVVSRRVDRLDQRVGAVSRRGLCLPADRRGVVRAHGREMPRSGRVALV